MVAENKQKYEKFIAAGGAIANVILNVSLIGSMGAIGATIATLITQIITNLLIGFMIPVIRQNSVLVLKSFDTIKYIGGLIKSVLTTDREKNDKERTKEL